MFAFALAAAVVLMPGQAGAQSSRDRKPSASASRQKEPLLLRNIFGSRKRPAAPQAAAVVQGAPLPQAVAVPATAPDSPAAPATVPVPVSGQPQEASTEVPPPSSASMADAIGKLSGKSGGDLIATASKAIDERRHELKDLAPALEGDPARLLSEGKRLLNDPALSASARQALEAVTAPGGSASKVTASSLEEMKQLGSHSELVAEGKQLLSENPELVAKGRELLRENRSLLDGREAQQLQAQIPDVRDKLAQLKAPLVIPATAVLPSGPLPPWVDKGVPLPRDPVADPIKRPEVQPEDVTRITAEFAKFDANTNVVTFEENVELRHHQFDLECQVLIAELKAGKDGAEKDPGLAKAQAAAGGIRRATARGFVIIQKMATDGKIQVAKSREAVYDAETGDAVLSDFPSLQDGKNLISATSQATKIYLSKNGKYEVKGPATYEIVPEGDALKTLQR